MATRSLPKWKTGDRITIDRLNAMQNATPGSVRVGPGLVSSGAHGDLRVALGDISKGNSAPADIRRFKVTAVEDDYLEAHLFDGDETEHEGETHILAKPWALRSPSDTTYSVDDIVLAARPIWGGTGLVVDDEPLPAVWEVISPTSVAGAASPGDTIPYIDSEIGSLGSLSVYRRDDTIGGLILFGSPGDATVDANGYASLEFTVDGGSRYGLRVRRLETYYDNGSGQRLIPIWLDTYGLSIPIDIDSPGNVTVTGTNDGLTASVGIQDILVGASKGDLLFYDGDSWEFLPIGDDGQVLTVDTDLPAWEDAGSGGGSPFAIGDEKTAFRTDDHTTNGHKWILEDGRTIGKEGSGADLADDAYEDLFLWFWNTAHYNPDTEQVVGGRGTTASSDWTAGKKLTLPDMTGGNTNPLSPVGASAGGSKPGKLQGAATHTHTGPNHQHLLGEHIFACGQHGHAVTEGSSDSAGALSFSHNTKSIYCPEGEPNTSVLDTTTHTEAAHVHGPGDYSTNNASVDASTDGTELTGESGTGNTGSTSSYHPVMARGFFLLAWIE